MALVLPTEDELICIKHCESKAITDFYNKNLADIERICFKHCIERQCHEYLIDCLNQVYVDLSCYDYSTLKSFYWSIKRSCMHACMFSAVVSLDKPITVDGATLGDFIPDKNLSVEEQLENDERMQETVAFTINTLTEILYKSNKLKKDEFIKLIEYLYPNLTEQEIKIYIGEK